MVLEPAGFFEEVAALFLVGGGVVVLPETPAEVLVCLTPAEALVCLDPDFCPRS